MSGRGRGGREISIWWDIPLDTSPTNGYSRGMKPVARDHAYRLRPDSKGRITLGKLAEGVSSYRARRQKDGKILLEPFVEIPADEAAALVARAREQAKMTETSATKLALEETKVYRRR